MSLRFIFWDGSPFAARSEHASEGLQLIVMNVRVMNSVPQVDPAQLINLGQAALGLEFSP